VSWCLGGYLNSYNYRLILTHFQEKTSKTDGTFPSKDHLTLHDMKMIINEEGEMRMADMFDQKVRTLK
jgi:hypothetical protein